MILALDFDGVIWDSVGECWVMAQRSHLSLYGQELTVEETHFRSGRWLVRTGGDFLLLLQLAQQGDLEEFPLGEFEALRQQKAAECQRFLQEFYRQRQNCRQQSWSEWTSFQRPYPEVLSALESLKGQKLAICTTKDSQSARELLESAGLDLKIYGRELALDKGQQMRQLCQDFQVPPTQVAFVDDLVENLDQVRPSGARCALAAWGYNTPAERQRARDLGYTVIDPSGLGELIGA